jgi:hypothetical protein
MELTAFQVEAVFVFTLLVFSLLERFRTDPKIILVACGAAKTHTLQEKTVMESLLA